MLIELHIRNLAIIESLDLAFSDGFNVMTGETGAGKSIIIDAVGLMLGARASSDMVRTGCDQAVVEGLFLLSEQTLAALAPFLKEQGLYDDPAQLVLQRQISTSGRSVSRVNGHPVTLNVLNEIGRHLVDIHGQGDHLSLLQTRQQLVFLDQYADLQPQREAFGDTVGRLFAVRRELAALRASSRQKARRMDLLEFQIREIHAARLTVGEEQELIQQRTLLANAEQRADLANQAYETLMGADGEQSASDLLGNVSNYLADLARLDGAMEQSATDSEAMLEQIEELARGLRRYRDEVEYDPQALEEVEERLALISNLERKYGDDITQVLAYCQRAETELESITHSEERSEELISQEDVLLRELAKMGQELSEGRKAAAVRLAQAIERELNELNMPDARFEVYFGMREDEEGISIGGRRLAFDRMGVDQIEFMIAPNPGEDPNSLAKTASGGETSRIMLALKVALCEVDPVPTLIFDEIDAGISGRAGQVVGEKLARLADAHQVFCITHLPQIAARGQAHYRVEKRVVGERTVSQVNRLDETQRIDELALMIRGQVTEAARQSASEMLAL